MTQNNDTCPTSDTGNHRYFIFKAVEVFEPVQDGTSGDFYYQKKEKIISGCNCGASISQVVDIT